MTLLIEHGWRLLPFYQEVLAAGANEVVKACGETASSAHELIFKLADRVAFGVARSELAGCEGRPSEQWIKLFEKQSKSLEPGSLIQKNNEVISAAEFLVWDDLSALEERLPREHLIV